MKNIEHLGREIRTYFQRQGEPFPGYATMKQLPNPTLQAHVSRMLHSFHKNKMKFQVELDGVLGSIDTHHDFELLVKCAIIIHDVGKLNPFFQYKMAGDGVIRVPRKATYHSFPSAMIATCLGLYLRSQLLSVGKNSIATRYLPFFLATSVINHHSRVFQRLTSRPIFDDYLTPMDDSSRLELLATFKEFFLHLTNSPFLRDIASEVEKAFGDPELATLLQNFERIVSHQFGNLHENDQAASQAIEDLLRKMKAEDTAASTGNDDRSLLFFITEYVASILDNLDTWEAMTGRTCSHLIKRIPFDIDRQVHDPVGLIPPYISRVKKDSPLNSYRDKFFNAMQLYSDALMPEDIARNRGKVYSITAPCGIGKTLGILYLALRLQVLSRQGLGHVPKVIYALPFISICDQVEEIAKDLLGLQGANQTYTITTHHHLADFGLPIYGVARKVSQNDDRDIENEAAGKDISDYEIDLWRSDLIITSSVRLFETIFRLSKNNLLRFNRLVNSIIILDEYHSIPLKYHEVIRTTMLVLSRYFNTQFVVATATTPAIFRKEELIEIIPDQATFFTGINRYRIAYSSTPMNEETFNKRMADLIKDPSSKDKSIMIVVNTTSRSRRLFLYLRERIEASIRPIFHLSGKIVPVGRKTRLNSIRKCLEDGKAPVLVTTQLIEAGIDVSFDHVVRDIGPLSSIVQVAGRCNRNAKMKEIPELNVVRVEHDADIYDGGSIQVTKNFFERLGNVIDESNLRERYIDYARLLREDINKDVGMCSLTNLRFDVLTEEFRIIDEMDGINMIVLSEADDVRAIMERLSVASFVPRDLLSKAITLTLTELKKILKILEDSSHVRPRKDIFLVLCDPDDSRKVSIVDSIRNDVNEREILSIILVLPSNLYDPEVGLVLGTDNENC